MVQLATGSVISHALLSHNGALYLHCLGQQQSLADSVPSLTKCAGWSVPDYRLPELVTLMRAITAPAVPLLPEVLHQVCSPASLQRIDAVAAGTGGEHGAGNAAMSIIQLRTRLIKGAVLLFVY